MSIPDDRTASYGPTFDLSPCEDPRGGFKSNPDFDIFAIFDNGAIRDANTGALTTTIKSFD